MGPVPLAGILAPNGVRGPYHSFWNVTDAPGLPGGALRFALQKTPISKSLPFPGGGEAAAGEWEREVGVRMCSGKREPPPDKPGASETVPYHSLRQMPSMPFGASNQ